jgi:hypothetical protein
MRQELLVPLDDTWVLAELGPMSLRIASWTGHVPAQQLALDAGRWAFHVLEQLAAFQEMVTQKNPWPDDDGTLPRPVTTMLEAVRHVGDEDLTPLAAVAGTISELVAEHLYAQGATKTIVDNGGDIAIRMLPDETVRVGIRLDVTRPDVAYYLQITPETGIQGVTTSGLGGRSFTKGVAQAAVVLGSRASVADAAATSVANATAIDSPRVQTIPADTLDPDTDLHGERVVTKIQTLSVQEVAHALTQGLDYSRRLVEQGVIFGALLSVQGEVAATEGLEELLFPLT